MPTLDQLREQLRSGEFGAEPKPESKPNPPAKPSQAEAPPTGKADGRDRMCRMYAMGKPDKSGVKHKKVYIIDLLKVKGTGEVPGANPTWEIHVAWGRVGNAMNEKRLLATTIKSKALDLYRKKMTEKLDKGYTIESQTGAE